MLFVTAFLFLILLFSALTAVVRIRPMPIIGALPVAFCLIIAVESIILNTLSLFHWVTFYGVLWSHVAVISCWLLWFSLFRKYPHKPLYRLIVATRRLARQPAMLALLPIIILLLFLLTHYPPNTGDSMAYHMARVAHWMQNQSVDYYFTNIDRQNEMGPGAEYLILFFQVLTNTDFFANSGQFFSFILLPGAMFYLLRILRVSQQFRPWIVVLTMSTPMLLFQSVTTQNDLVASLVTVAIIITSLRLFAGKVSNSSLADYFFLGMCLSVGFLVKPTSVLVALPVISVGIVLQVLELVKYRKALLYGMIVIIGTTCIVAGPDLYRKNKHEVSRLREVHSVSEMLTMNHKYSQNQRQKWLMNPVRITIQNSPWPEATAGFFRTIGIIGKLYFGGNYHPHANYIGNPIQIVTFVAVSFSTFLFLPLAIINRRKYFFSFCLSLAPLLSWIIFGLVVRNNPWITRVQLPLFVLLPLTFVFLSRLIRNYKPISKLFSVVLIILAGTSLMYGFFALSHSKNRPLDMSDFFRWPDDRTTRYYAQKIKFKEEHDAVIRGMIKEKCSRLGLIINRESKEYPLTWRVMRLGLNTQHISENSNNDWACMAYLDGMEVPPFLSQNRWEKHAEKNIWYRNEVYEFENSTTSCSDDVRDGQLDEIKPLNSTLVKYGDRVEITVTGKDPQILLPSFSCERGKSALLKIVVNSPVTCKALLFYRTEQGPNYSEKQYFAKTITPGLNQIYFLLPVDKITGHLRFDFEVDSGIFEILSVGFRQ